jgi:hypothetical protein
MCPNIDGVQSTVPVNMIIDPIGNCVYTTTDMCLNIDGIQDAVPYGYVADANQNCWKISSDMCPNLPGDQPIIPSGMVKDVKTGDCLCKLPKVMDPKTNSCSENYIYIEN